MKKMRIIIGCEKTQIVTNEFRKLGHDAYSCDLQETDGDPRWHIKGDVLDVLSDGWDMGLFFPDCTYLTGAAEWLYKTEQSKTIKYDTLIGEPRREARRQAIAFVIKLWNAPIEKLGIENPVGILSTEWTKPTQYIQPYQYGDDASKKTCLWLRNLRPLIPDPADYIEPRWVCCGEVLDVDKLGKYGCPNCEGTKKPLPRWANQTNSGQNKEPPHIDRAAKRSATFPGIAKAMAFHWG